MCDQTAIPGVLAAKTVMPIRR